MAKTSEGSHAFVISRVRKHLHPQFAELKTFQIPFKKINPVKCWLKMYSKQKKREGIIVSAQADFVRNALQ